MQELITELAKAEYAALTNEECLTQLLAIEETKYKMISSNVAELYFADIGKLRALEAKALADDGPVSDLCYAATRTISKSTGEFNVNPEHPFGVKNILSINYLVISGILTEEESNNFLALGAYVIYPFKDYTLDDVKQIRNPGTDTLCVHGDGSQDFIVSASNRDYFTFVATFIEDCEKITISIEWREDLGQPWKTHDDKMILRGGLVGETKSYNKPRVRLPSGRHFRFTYLTDSASSVSQVNVTKSE